jgi:hypothetical protein
MCLRLGPPSAKIQWSVKVVIMKDGANDELQGLSFRDNDCKPRFSEIGGAMSIGGSINVEPCHTTRSLRHGIPFHTYII